MAQKEYEYTNGEVTIVWKPDACIHSTKCVQGLPKVFQPKERPWIKADAAGSEDLVAQVQKCPSGALSYFYNDGRETKSEETASLQVAVIPNGPLMVSGDLEVILADGSSEKRQKKTAFCRCGASGNKPYCDGSHQKVGFKG